MNLPKVTDLAKLQARFAKYQDGKLWYSIVWCDPEGEGDERFKDFYFPIPIADAGGGEFLPTDKGLTFMRWIRKHLFYR